MTNTRVHSATASFVTFTRIGGCIAVNDGNTGRRIGAVSIIRGFAHYCGVEGSAHAGFDAVIRGGIDGLTAALKDGIVNGRDDRK